MKMLLTAAAYFCYNNRYFAFASAATGRPTPGRRYTVCCFVLNYTVFILLSVIQVHLIVNWSLLFLLLFAETLPVLRGGLLLSALLSLQSALIGLGINIFSRCLITLVLDLPLTAVNNNTLEDGNVKSYPVLAGFVLAGLAFQLFLKPVHMQEIRLALRFSKHMRVFLIMLFILYGYLSLNLLLYSASQNLTMLKLWGMKSVLFVAVGYHFGLRYTIRMCRLSDYREQNEKMRTEVHTQRREAESLRSLAYRDSLTGLFNRSYARDFVHGLCAQQQSFCLCFVDLDGLKRINDRIGHTAGDSYLMAVAQEIVHVLRPERDRLFRYGGDEFLAVLPGLSLEEAEQKMREAGRMLRAYSDTAAYPFALSFSFGAVQADGALGPDELIRAADEKMYLQKQQATKTAKAARLHSRAGSGG